MSENITKPENLQTLEQWTEVLCEQEMPIFSNTAQNIYSSLDDKKKGAMELASVILQDPNLTTKLLKVSNSSFYNPSRQKMSTISRAIVILGSQTVRELTIACSFFESIISSENKQRANEEIGHAIHAAVQAKEIAIACNDPSPEEIFIAALLNNIGRIAFWCFGGKQSQYISDLIQSGSFSSAEAENKVLGFNLSELSTSLGKSWKLGGLIEQAINNPSSSNNRVKTVLLGKQITDAINEGWESENMKHCLKKLEPLTGQNKSALKSNLRQNTASAVKIAHKFGAHDASHYIQPNMESTLLSQPNDEVDQTQIQFHILQDITTHLSGNINLNLLLEMVLEGIHRGLCMDRSIFCLLSQDKKSLVEKLSLGWLKTLNTDKIKLEISSIPANLFFKAINSPNGIWATPKSNHELYTPYVVNSIGHAECFLIPIHRENHPIGLIYSDRSINNKPLTKEDFKVAQHFVQQAIIGLALYKIKTPM